MSIGSPLIVLDDALPLLIILFVPFKHARERVKVGQQWRDLLCPILLTYNRKVVHSAEGLTPKGASKRLT